MNFTGHIELEEWKGKPMLTVRDCELLDFLQDLFIEQLGMETSQIRPPSSPPVYQLLFSASTTKAAVWRALEAVGREEIERIVAINNGGE